MSDKNQLGKRFEFNNVYISEPRKYWFLNVYQVGELACEGGYVVEPHYQYCNEISYIVSGEGWFSANGKEVRVSSGDIIINSKGHTHMIRSDKDRALRYLYLAFDFFEPYPEEYLELVDLFLNIDISCMKDRSEITIPFKKLMNEVYYKKPLSVDMIDSYIKQIVVIAYRAFKDQLFVTKYPDKSENVVGDIVYTIICYVEDNIYNLMNIQDLANHIGYSYSYVSHLFKIKVGVPLQSYIANRKIEKCMELIENGQLSISEIASKLNYANLQSFSKSFKKIAGCSPTEYRKRCNHN
ncbi:MAG TPA: hypothetical protein DEB10_11110 [Ruminococcaceae bacterium]|nr:hypothetical protein [Oscillospiraceae bacterium]